MHELVFDGHGSMVRWNETPGRAPARVFIHGLGGTGSAIHAETALDPALGGHRTLILDLPGHGHSDRPGDFGYSLDDHASVVAEVCVAAGIDDIDLVGHSLGADIAIVVAVRNTGLVRRLVVSEGNLDPLPVTPDGERWSQRIAAQGESEFVARGYGALLRDVPTWAPTLRLASPVAVFRSARELLAGTTPAMRDLLYGLSIPRTFIRGDRGEPLLDEAGLRASGVRLEVVADAGHMMMLDQPASYLAALARSLA